MDIESSSSAFLSGFSHYYSEFTEGGDFIGSPDGMQNDYSDGSDPYGNYQQGYYLSDPTCPPTTTISIQTLEAGSDDYKNEVPVPAAAMDSSSDYFTLNLDQMAVPTITIADSTSTLAGFDLDYPFDWDLNLDNLITTKLTLPDLTPLCNDMCSEFLGESSEIMATVNQRQGEDSQQVDDPSVAIEINEEKPKFQCNYDQCRKIYAKAAHLRSHLRRHLGHKPYVCTEINCQWRFNRSDELARHRRSHSGIKPYPCDYCSKTFSRSDHLAKHRKVHERKFASGKAKGVWRVLPKAKPGRKPKALSKQQEM